MLRRLTWIIVGVEIVHFQQVLVSYVAGEGVEWTVRKESVVVGEI